MKRFARPDRDDFRSGSSSIVPPAADGQKIVGTKLPVTCSGSRNGCSRLGLDLGRGQARHRRRNRVRPAIRPPPTACDQTFRQFHLLRFATIRRTSCACCASGSTMAMRDKSASTL